MYLPPATPDQVRAVYAGLHVTPAMVNLDLIYDRLYFVTEALYLLLLIAFLQTGLSAALRTKADFAAERLLSRGTTARLRRSLSFITYTPLYKFLRRGRTIRTLIEAWEPRAFRSTLIYYAVFSLAVWVIWMPLRIYGGYLLPQAYGLSHEPFLDWLWDHVKDFSFDLLLETLAAALIVWLIGVYPRRWPIILASWTAPLMLVGIFLTPVLFDTLDNSFTPLPRSSPLYAPLHALAAKAGVPKATIVVADKSRQTDESNAYVTGLGSSARIVLWDTLITKTPVPEVVAITGHELGHYVEHHVLIGGAIASAAMFIALPLLSALALFLLHWKGAGWKIRSLNDPAAIPVLLIALELLTFFSSPLQNAVSRVFEHRADSFGLGLTRDRVAMADGFIDLSEQNLEDPYPPQWATFWLADHPPLGARVAYALTGQPGK